MALQESHGRVDEASKGRCAERSGFAHDRRSGAWILRRRGRRQGARARKQRGI
jgi:hypothetical protein